MKEAKYISYIHKDTRKGQLIKDLIAASVGFIEAKFQTLPNDLIAQFLVYWLIYL